MDVDTSFQLADDHAVVQVLDFDPMEYENYGNQTQITLIELQNVTYSELFLEDVDNEMVEDNTDNQIVSDDIGTIPSYESFVRYLNSWETDDFENEVNSTTIEKFNRIYETPDENMKCPDDCNCERCLQIYFIAETSDFDCFNVTHASAVGDFENFLYVENITNANLVYDFTRLWNEAELTEYLEFPRQEMYSNTSFC
ncbi:hypothetical protein HA402_011401 [Bradysia odoriphaga]|nr:hypothetical protein HA402_011401 [Bradysia odoriphaga]